MIDEHYEKISAYVNEQDIKKYIYHWGISLSLRRRQANNEFDRLSYGQSDSSNTPDIQDVKMGLRTSNGEDNEERIRSSNYQHPGTNVTMEEQTTT